MLACKDCGAYGEHRIGCHIGSLEKGMHAYRVEAQNLREQLTAMTQRAETTERLLAEERAARESEHRCELWRQECDGEIREDMRKTCAEKVRALEDERDAWMAHVERLRELSDGAADALNTMIYYSRRPDGWKMLKGAGPDWIAARNTLMDFLDDETPPISLAKRDARVMREAAEICSKMGDEGFKADLPAWVNGCGACQNAIEARADEMEGRIGSDTHA